MPLDKYELGKKMIALASQLRDTGDKLSVDAYTRLIAKNITRKEYDEIHDNVESIYAQAMEIHKQIAEWPAGSIDMDLNGIESATAKLKLANDQISKVKKIVNVAIDACATVGLVVLASTTPNPETIAAAIKATIDIAEEINKMNVA